MHALKAPAQRIRGLAIAGAVSLLATVGCGSNSPTEPARQQPNAVLTVLDGDGQDVPAGGQFPKPVRVLLTLDGTPAANHSVGVLLIEPRWPTGLLTGSSTDASGVAEIQRQVGSIPGTFTLRIYYSWCPKPGFKECQVPELQLATVSVTGTIVPSS